MSEFEVAGGGNVLEFELHSNGGVTVTITNELAQISKSSRGIYCMAVRLDNSNRQQLIKMLTIKEVDDG